MTNYTAKQTVYVPGYGVLSAGESADVPDSPDTEFLIKAGALAPARKTKKNEEAAPDA